MKRSSRSGRVAISTAGVLLAVLLFKPQYLLLMLLVLLWKRRWNAFAGFIAGGLVILAASVLVAGPAVFVAYIRTLIDFATASAVPCSRRSRPR